MQENNASRTAERVALRRAAHQLFDDPKVLDDPFAVTILGQPAAVLRADAGQTAKHPLARAMRAFMAVRSRFAEDQLARAYQDGIRQYVVLGAGLDTSAYRSSLPGLCIFEVDHPATQAWKRERLQQSAIPIPDSLVYVPLDFERQTLAEGLSAAGFDTTAPAFFSWLGVVPYLSREAIIATLGFIATATPEGSAVVFDYAIEPDSLNPAQRKVFDYLAQKVADMGEPWQSFFMPAALECELITLGYRSARDTNAEELNARYFSGRQDGLSVGELTHIMLAQV